MPKIQINDISMYYEMHGQGEPIVFIAGFSADHTTWLLVSEILKANYQVILFDNRGAGQTDVPSGAYSIEQMAADVAALCAELKIDKAHFVGNSMGGFILQALALQHPGLVKSAFISNSALNAHCSFNVYLAAQRKLLESNAALADLLHASCSWLFSYRFLNLPGNLDQFIQLGLDNPYPFSLPGYDGQYAALVHFNSSEWASKIQVPVYVLGAEQDLIFIEKTTRRLAEQITHANYHCLQECGHLPMLEFPEKFCELVHEFIRDQSR